MVKTLLFSVFVLCITGFEINKPIIKTDGLSETMLARHSNDQLKSCSDCGIDVCCFDNPTSCCPFGTKCIWGGAVCCPPYSNPGYKICCQVGYKPCSNDFNETNCCK
jgi:hypothetical protein